MKFSTFNTHKTLQ